VIDLHSHLLPGIDDGARDMDGAVRLGRAAVEDGVRVLAATPHLRPDFPLVRPGEVAERVNAVRGALARAGLRLEVVAAAEVDVHRGVAASDEELRLASYGQTGTDLLVETPYGALPADFETLLFRLAARGYRILLAHPERNRSFQADPPRLAAIARAGTLLQVTAGSLVEGSRVSRTRRFARALVAEGVAHVIASDAHGATVARAPLSAGVAAADRLAAGRGAWMAEDAPAAILAGEPLPPAPQGGGRRRGLLT
jgi:protein-tyrosine phosphatase